MPISPDDDVNETAGTEGIPTLSTGVTGGSTPSGSVTTPMSGGAGARTRSAPDRFVNFQDFYNANSGTASRMASNVASGLETKAQDANKALTQVQDAFGNQVTQSANQTNPRFNVDGNNVQAVQNAQYGGPTDITQTQGYQGAMSGARDAGRNLAQARSVEGIQTLLGQANPGMSQNASRFNAALTQRAGGDRFQALWDTYSKNLEKAGVSTQEFGNKAVGDARTAVQARNTAAQADLGRRNRANQNSDQIQDRGNDEVQRDERKNRFSRFNSYYGAP